MQGYQNSNIAAITYKYPSLFISQFKKFNRDKQIELPNIMWEPVPEGMELYFVQALHQYDTKNML